MSRKFTMNLLWVGLAAFVFACSGGEGDKKAENKDQKQPKKEEKKAPEEPKAPEVLTMTANGITLTEASDHHSFSQPTITMTSPGVDGEVEAGTVAFAFDVQGEDYTLGEQTPDAAATMCANSGKGQHIHFILNNQPYKAHYTAEFEENVPEGENILLAFLSRSYHESVKTPGAYVLQRINAGESNNEVNLMDEHLFYSRPKGTYKGAAEWEHLLLDFYVVNTLLAEGGNNVKVTIDGSTEFMLPKWCPYIIEGLGVGELTVRIQLVDAEGNQIPGPYNDSGDRSFTLAELPAGDQAAQK